MKVCVILHNMIIEDEHNNYELAFECDIVEWTGPEPIVSYQCHPCYETCFQIMAIIRDSETHARLQADLMEETWK